MSVWVLHQPVGAEEEAQITTRPMLTMPWQGIPNLGGIHQQPELRKLIAQMMPDAPPETITLRTQVVWKGFSELQKEDLIAVPLPQSKWLALAEITGAYHYQPASVGKAATHGYPVRWFSKTVPLSRFGKDIALLTDDSVPLWEVENAKLRNLIRDQVPLGYNRFRKLRWLLALAFVIHLVRMAHDLLFSSE